MKLFPATSSLGLYPSLWTTAAATAAAELNCISSGSSLFTAVRMRVLGSLLDTRSAWRGRRAARAASRPLKQRQHSRWVSPRHLHRQIYRRHQALRECTFFLEGGFGGCRIGRLPDATSACGAARSATRASPNWSPGSGWHRHHDKAGLANLVDEGRWI